MYKVYFNDTILAQYDNEIESIKLSLNLHNNSNIPHNIIVTKDEETIIYFIQK